MSKITKDEFVKNQILEGAKEVFRKYGYKNAKMEHIAVASGKGRSTLYYYYKSKDDVFKAFIQNYYQNVIQSVRSKVDFNNTVDQNFSIYSEERLQHLMENLKTYNNLLIDFKNDMDFMSHLLVKVKDEEIEIIMNCLKWAIDKKEILEIPEEKLQFLAVAIVTSTGSIEKEIFLYETIKGDPFESIKWINELVLKALK